VAQQLISFAIAYSFQIDKITDFSGTLNFVVVACLGYLQTPSPSLSARQQLILLLVFFWAVRLGSFLVYRVLDRKKDARFDKMRSVCFYSCFRFFARLLVRACF